LEKIPELEFGLKMDAKVAVICRTKNRPLLLKRAVRSVFEQKFKDWQLVIVNDGGEPGAVTEVLDTLQDDENIKRVKVIHNKESKGMERASNIGIDNSDSKYVVIHDDDDSWDSMFLEECVTYLENLPPKSKCKGVVSHIIEITEKIKGTKIKEIRRRYHNPDLFYISFFEMAVVNQFLPISFLFFRDAWEAVGKYDESLPVVGDWEFNLRFLTKFDISVLPKSLAFYHLRRKEKGVYGNTLIAERNIHKIYDAQIRNHLLRKELEKKELGLGFFLNTVAASNYLLRHRLETVYNSNLFRIERVLKRIFRKIFRS
jgi:glycosyltransferase involved in cell wall biosynthesis